MSDDADRSLEPTDQRREEFRKQGRFARARDGAAVAATAAVIAVLSGTQRDMSHQVRVLFQRTLGDLGALERLGPAVVLQACTRALFELITPVVFAAVIAGVVIGAAQTQLKTFPELLEPKLDKLNPTQGIMNLFAFKRTAMETGVALFRVALVGVVSWRALSAELPLLDSLARVPLDAAIPAMLASLGRAAGTAVGALFLVAVFDYGQSWFTLSKEMMMTFKERQDEAKQSEGDAKAKGKMKAKARALSRKRSMNAVKTADVVVTNPTHVAVALRYGPKDPAPIVIAKGHDEVALRIRAEARKHGIPILENRRLARALDAEVQLGRMVPAAHFAAVARVLAFVYRLPGRKRKT